MSHLRELIRRVKEHWGLPYPYVASVMDYFEYFTDHTADERYQAGEILSKFGLDIKLTPSSVLMARYYGAKGNWKRSCIRCGRLINGESKMIRGMGPECNRVTGKGEVVPPVRFGPMFMKLDPRPLDPTLFLEWLRRQQE